MQSVGWRRGFWLRWVAANSVAELVGLGTVAAVAFVVVSRIGEPQGAAQALAFSLLFILLGAFEGLVVGWAQVRVLRKRLPAIDGWVRATVVGAVAAWVLGMLPSMIMSLGETVEGSAPPPPEVGEPLRLLLAAGLGFVAGPVLAFFQWRVLRRYVQRAAWWLPANAAAWAVGMPVVFLGAHISTYTIPVLAVVVGVATTLAIAGAAVGAIHGRALLLLLSAEHPDDAGH
jgi:hypothetical protein